MSDHFKGLKNAATPATPPPDTETVAAIIPASPPGQVRPAVFGQYREILDIFTKQPPPRDPRESIFTPPHKDLGLAPRSAALLAVQLFCEFGDPPTRDGKPMTSEEIRDWGYLYQRQFPTVVAAVRRENMFNFAVHIERAGRPHLTLKEYYLAMNRIIASTERPVAPTLVRIPGIGGTDEEILAAERRLMSGERF